MTILGVDSQNEVFEAENQHAKPENPGPYEEDSNRLIPGSGVTFIAITNVMLLEVTSNI